MLLACSKSSDDHASPVGCSNPTGDGDVVSESSACVSHGAAEESVDQPCSGSCEDGNAARPAPLPRRFCPEIPPTLGSPCGGIDGLCGYGDSNIAACRSYFHCDGGRWRLAPGLAELSCPESPSCPASYPHGESCVVAAKGFTDPCEYPGGFVCYCGLQEAVPPGGTSVWQCWGPPHDTRCPERLPNIGEGCEDDALACTYTPEPCVTLATASVTCSEGTWQIRQGQFCP